MPIKKHDTSFIIVGVIAFSQGVLGLSDLALSYLYKDDFKMSPAEVKKIELCYIFWKYYVII